MYGDMNYYYLAAIAAFLKKRSIGPARLLFFFFLESTVQPATLVPFYQRAALPSRLPTSCRSYSYIARKLIEYPTQHYL